MTIVFIRAREKLSLNLCTAVLEELCRQKNYPYLVKLKNLDWSRENCRADADELWNNSRANRVLVPLSPQYEWQQIESWLNECGFIEDFSWRQNVVLVKVIGNELEAREVRPLSSDERIYHKIIFNLCDEYNPDFSRQIDLEDVGILPKSSRFTAEDLWKLWLFEGSWQTLCQRNSPLPYRIKEPLQRWSKESIEAFDRAKILNPVAINAKSLVHEKVDRTIDW
jgi:hypothetical protein